MCKAFKTLVISQLISNVSNTNSITFKFTLVLYFNVLLMFKIVDIKMKSNPLKT